MVSTSGNANEPLKAVPVFILLIVSLRQEKSIQLARMLFVCLKMLAT